MKTINNPFITYGYKGNRYFCDRENETKKLIEALQNDRNVTLISPRRVGKTGLIKHVFS
ncbi:MAG: ATP-binding protein, partial [Prevotella oris]|nr:ATP-binding protein [Segatella oris]